MVQVPAAAPIDPPTAAAVDAAVRSLVGRYCAAVFVFDLDAFASCWAEDAEWIAKGTVIAGRARIQRVFGKLRAPFPLCVQEPLSGVIDVHDTDQASARWVVRETQWLGGGDGVALYGTYVDDCRRDADGVWRFTRRRFEERFRGPVPLPGELTDPA